MPRRSRISVAEVPVHIVQRGHNRSACFYCDEDRALYLAQLRELATKFECAVHAHCLMTNHVHLLLTSVVELPGQRDHPERRAPCGAAE